MPRIGSKLTRARPLSPNPKATSSTLFQPKPLARAKPLSAMDRPATRPVKHPGDAVGGPSHIPFKGGAGEAGKVMVSGGDNKLKVPPNAHETKYLDKPGKPFETQALGGTVKTNVGSAKVSTATQNGGGVHHYSAQAEFNGPSASYQAQKVHAGRLGLSTAQLTAEANTFKSSAQAGISADRRNHQYTAAMTAKAETGVGVTASASHDFNRHVGGFVKGDAKAGASAFAEGFATLDPRATTALVSGKVGAAATAGVYGTAGGHLGRLHGSVTGGAVAGAAAQAMGRFGVENGVLRQVTDLHAAAGVGTHFKTDVAVDLRHHIKPGIVEGLRPSLATAAGVGSSAGVVKPEKSHAEQLFAKVFGL
ncbi:hypothetical protein [Hyalangium gracile]|uniref:hypothetical protein n=1 Tax=Hyalangium gracile TaxID=394092 RepID=UPI001CCD45B2|nr:hypothetical protein [Hyalangium gracile]